MTEGLITAEDMKELYGEMEDWLAEGLARTQRRMAIWCKRHPGKVTPTDVRAARDLTEEEMDEWYEIE